MAVVNQDEFCYVTLLCYGILLYADYTTGVWVTPIKLQTAVFYMGGSRGGTGVRTPSPRKSQVAIYVSLEILIRIPSTSNWTRGVQLLPEEGPYDHLCIWILSLPSSTKRFPSWTPSDKTFWIRARHVPTCTCSIQKFVDHEVVIVICLHFYFYPFPFYLC